MNPRALSFNDLNAAGAEADRLLRSGYDRAGNWTLGQICEHLSFAMNNSIDGFHSSQPWYLKGVLGPTAWRIIRSRGKLVGGRKSPPAAIPKMGIDDVVSVAVFKNAIARVAAHAGEYSIHPFFGRLKPADMVKFHVLHAAHHLGFLIPKS